LTWTELHQNIVKEPLTTFGPGTDKFTASTGTHTFTFFHISGSLNSDGQHFRQKKQIEKPLTSND
jgi:hypothetical protein